MEDVPRIKPGRPRKIGDAEWSENGLRLRDDRRQAPSHLPVSTVLALAMLASSLALLVLTIGLHLFG
ncbi:hypothetical protein [Erythrobacter sp. JK5]|uniref:hypothetical protein n=1 Tax=Erythrobacter sp. JK5 TaxID=2829500 RepID=UPI001BAE084E|nr:hypothetical protein [Erythrobacter sp. JK5]QUL37019.1 hypothetical protein KDC96_11520 [Erythrobacter sp. JK5]